MCWAPREKGSSPHWMGGCVWKRGPREWAHTPGMGVPFHPGVCGSLTSQPQDSIRSLPAPHAEVGHSVVLSPHHQGPVRVMPAQVLLHLLSQELWGHSQKSVS